MTFQAQRAREYYRRGAALIPLVERVSRPALWAMIEIYSRLLERIMRADYDVFRCVIRLPVREKCSIALRALAMRLLPALAAWR